MNLEDFRRSYNLGKLNRRDLAAEPIVQFESWLKEMLESDMPDPTAMVLATVGTDLMPQQRYVLLKKFSADGFVFFTDTQSCKGQDIEQNSKVGLLFPWHAYERQVRVSGVARPLDRQQVSKYFHSRPVTSQVAAFSSQQSREIESRELLEQRYRTNLEQMKEQAPLQDRWGGYLVTPTQFEFWQGGEHRLHDRFEYIRANDAWTIRRLQP